MHPFLFFGSGWTSYRDYPEYCIWFKHKIAKAKLQSLFKDLNLPSIFARFFDDQAVYFEGNKGENFKILAEKMEEWLLKIDQLYPIAFVLNPAKSKRNLSHYDDWHQWSIEHFLDILPFLKEYFLKRFEQNFAVRLSASIRHFLAMYLQNFKDKSFQTLAQKIKLLDFVEFLCEHDGVYQNEEIFENGYYRQVLFEQAQLLILLLKNFPDDKQKQLISKFKPYTQLVLFVGAGDDKNFPSLLFFDQPNKYLRRLVGKIDSKRKGALSGYIELIMMEIFIYWKDRKFKGENKDALLNIVDFALSLPNCQGSTYIRAEIIYEKYKVKDKLAFVRKKINEASDIVSDEEIFNEL